MPQRVYTVELDGKQYDLEGDHPPTEAEARAAISAHEPKGKSVGGLLMNAVNDVVPAATSVAKGLKDTAVAGGTVMSALSGNPESGAKVRDFARGVPGMAAGLWTKAKEAASDPMGTARAVGNAAYEHPVQAAMSVDPFIPGGGPISRGAGLVTKGVGGALKWAAPQAMDMGLQRTMADRLEFPNTPQRLVDEGIIPHGKNVQNALTDAESAVNSHAASWDAAHPNPHMIATKGADPQRMATAASGSAVKEGKVAGLGNVPGPEDDEIARLAKEYLDHNTRPRGLTETVEQKRSYQARSNYNNRPNAPTQTNNEVNFNRGIAKENRAEAARMEPAIADELSREQDLIGALTATEKMGAKSTPLSTVGTAKTLLGLRNPTVMGSAGIALDRTGRALQAVTPEMVRAILASLLASHAVDQ